MSANFLETSRAKTLSLATVLRMSDREAEGAFRQVRWPETNGAAVCPWCQSDNVNESRRRNGASRFRCRTCLKDFSVTSGTLFANHKASLRAYLAAILLSVNEVKGKNALALSRDLGMSYKACWIMLHKIREGLSEEFRGRTVGGEGVVAELDAAFFGGHITPANKKEDRKDRRMGSNKKRRAVVVLRERHGRSVTGVFPSERASVQWVATRLARGTILNADESSAWNSLHARFDMRRINHSIEYANGDTSTNWAESFFSRLRRGELGHYHHISGTYLHRYGQEAAFKEDNRRVSNGEQVRRISGLAMSRGPSVDFSGYYQRHVAQ